MVILGIDPGTVVTGFGIISFKDNSFDYIDSGVIKTNVSTSMPERLNEIYTTIDNIIIRYKPEEFAIETAFYGKNVQSAMKLGFARGVSMLAAVRKNLEIGEYSPREVKKAVVGKGSASKEQVTYMVATLLNLDTEDMKFDETDALAVACCHALKHNSPVVSKGNWKSFIANNPDRIIE